MRLSWVPGHNPETMREELWRISRQDPKKLIAKRSHFNLPNRLWQRLVEVAGMGTAQRWADLRKDQANKLTEEQTGGKYQIKGKRTF